MDMTAVKVTDNPDQQRFELTVDGELAGYAEYERRPGRITFTHTVVEEAFGGKGLGSVLAREVLDTAREEKLAVLPQCPFIRGWIRKHPGYVELVPEAARSGFEL